MARAILRQKIKFFTSILSVYIMLNLLGTSKLMAQNFQDIVRIEQITLEDGLSQVSVNDLLRDSNGFVWVATQDGLNRFDGNKFEQFKNRRQDSTSISGNYINALEEDVRGNIWIGTQGNGLCWFDVEHGVFYTYKLPNTSYRNESISDVLLGENGVLWVASKVSGLHKLVFSKGQYAYGGHFEIPAINILHEGKDGILWIGDAGGNLYSVEVDLGS